MQQQHYPTHSGMPQQGMPPGACPPTPPGSRMHGHTPSPNHNMHFLGPGQPPGPGPMPPGGMFPLDGYGMPPGAGGPGPGMKRPYHMMGPGGHPHQNGNGMKISKDHMGHHHPGAGPGPMGGPGMGHMQPKITDHPSYPEKKPRPPSKGRSSGANKFNGMSEEEVSKRTLPDYLREGLDVVFIGINPSMFAAYTGR